jgi:hypothetical protein
LPFKKHSFKLSCIEVTAIYYTPVGEQAAAKLIEVSLLIA